MTTNLKESLPGKSTSWKKAEQTVGKANTSTENRTRNEHPLQGPVENTQGKQLRGGGAYLA